MKHRLQAAIALRKCNALTKAKVRQRGQGRQDHPGCSFRMAALPMMMTTDPCVLPFNRGSANSRALQGNVVPEVSINVTKRAVTVRSHITFARTLTDIRWRRMQFHQQLNHNWMRQWFHNVHPCSLSSVQVKPPFQKLLSKQGSELSAWTMKWPSRLHQ